MCIDERERDIAGSEAPKEADISGGDSGSTEGGVSRVLNVYWLTRTRHRRF
jgi:hypothetical protein